MSDRSHHRHFKENGMVLLLTALLITTIFSLCALGVDLAFIFSGVNQVRSASKFVALAAIKEYYAYVPDKNNPPANIHEARVAAALAGAQAVWGNNTVLSLGTGNKLAISSLLNFDTGARLIPGTYKFVDPGADPAVACGAKESPEYPYCFKKYDATTNNVVTAFLLVGPLYEKIGGIFKHFSGQVAEAEVETVATLQPTLFSVLLDRSLSTNFMTHSQVDALPNYWKSYFAYSDPSLGNADWTALQAHGVRGGDGLPPGPATGPERHYHDDYDTISISADGYVPETPQVHPDPNAPYANADYRGGTRFSTSPNKRLPAIAGDWMVDLYRNPGAGMVGPQPFTAILNGMDVALGEFRKTLQFGDAASLIPFSHVLYWTSVVLPQTTLSGFDYIREYTDLDADGEALKAGLFPAKFEYTSPRLAIEEFGRHFNSLGERNMLGAAVIVTDGISNCYRAYLNGQGYGTWIYNPLDGTSKFYPCITGTSQCQNYNVNGSAVYYRCGDSYQEYNQATSELLNYVKSSEVKGKFPIHVIVTGPSGNLRNIQGSGENNCMTQEEAVTQGIFPVQSESTHNERADHYYDALEGTGGFYHPGAVFFEIASATGGVYVNIRPYDPNCNDTCTGTVGAEGPLIQCSHKTEQQQVIDAFKQVFGKKNFLIGYAR